MTLFTTINLALELAIQYLRLKIKTSTFDILEKFDARMDKLDEKRQKLRTQNSSAAQKQADEVLAEIIEEKKKFAIWKQELDKSLTKE